MSMWITMSWFFRGINFNLFPRLRMLSMLSHQIMMLRKCSVIISFLINTRTHIWPNTVERGVSLLEIWLICINLMWRTWIMSLAPLYDMRRGVVMNKLILVEMSLTILNGDTIINVCLITFKFPFSNVLNKLFLDFLKIDIITIFYVDLMWCRYCHFVLSFLSLLSWCVILMMVWRVQVPLIIAWIL